MKREGEPRLFAAWFCIAAAVCNVGFSAPPDAVELEFFERRIRPILAERCYECHSADVDEPEGGLRLDSGAAVLAGGDRGPALVAGMPDESLLAAAVSYDDTELQMPPGGKLPQREIVLLREWIVRGAKMPAGNAPLQKKTIDWEQAREFWSFQSPSVQPLPRVENRNWPDTRIDFFILAQLQQHGLSPSPPADRRTLIRRAWFDLVGLPPPTDEVAAFEADDSPTAYARLLDRLLASPRYGERWGRYWLDLVRYTDTTASWLKKTDAAYLYRDWVIAALNGDAAYDDFVKRQLATDLMAETGPDDLPALGLLGLSPTYWKEPRLAPDVIKTVVAEEWEERIDAVGRTFLGLTLACARCHDHKFDPVTVQDYYALAGVFASTRIADRWLLPPDEARAVAAAHERVAELQAKLAELKQKKDVAESDAENEKSQIEPLQRQIAEIKRDTPHFDAPRANAVDEASLYVMPDGPDKTKLVYKPDESRDVAVQMRGSPSRLGAVAPRRFLKVLSVDDDPPPFRHGSGRLELAKAIVGEGAPLAARVIVNRVWRHHFGQSLVSTPSNFGAQGAAPTHPRLLDDLAARFIDSGWSLKWLHREIMLSAAYRQSSAHDERQHAIDPANQWLWRANLRRLDIEAWRDSVLLAAGKLDSRIGGPPLILDDPHNRRRTVYGAVNRRDVHVMLRLHDFPDPTRHSPQREATTTPLQQLFVLNSPFIQQQSAALAERLRGAGSDEDHVRRAYRLLFARQPNDAELSAALEFVSEGDEKEVWIDYVQALLAGNEFLFIE